jgi:GcrA cell cycle regulator
MSESGKSHTAGWTEPRVARLKKLWVEGKSATEIAKDLSGGLTRNGVIGKVHRLGLSADRAKPAKPDTYRPPRAPVVKPKVKPEAMRRPPRQKDVGKAPVVFAKQKFDHVHGADLERRREERRAYGQSKLDAFAPANDDAIPLISRRFSQCAWPVGEPDRPEGQLCCGAEVVEGKPYCAHHASVAYQPMTPKQRDWVRSLRRFA